MIIKIVIENIGSIEKETINFEKGKYDFKENMIYNEGYVNPIALYGNNGSGKTVLLKIFKHLLTYMIKDPDSIIDTFLPNFKLLKNNNNNNNNNKSTITIDIILNKIKYTYLLSTSFTDIIEEVLIKEDIILLKRNKTNYKIYGKELSFDVEGETYPILRKIGKEEHNEESVEFHVKKIFKYLSNIVFLDVHGEVLSKNTIQKGTFEFLAEKGKEIFEYSKKNDFMPNFKIVKIPNREKDDKINRFGFILNDDNKYILPIRLISDGMLSYSKIISELLSTEENSLIVIDEIERCLHPLVIEQFFKVAKEKNIQMIFSSHNTNILQSLRPDQIFFAKIIDGYSKYSKLSNIYKNIREVNNIEKMYLNNSFDTF